MRSSPHQPHASVRKLGRRGDLCIALSAACSSRRQRQPQQLPGAAAAVEAAEQPRHCRRSCLRCAPCGLKPGRATASAACTGVVLRCGQPLAPDMWLGWAYTDLKRGTMAETRRHACCRHRWPCGKHGKRASAAAGCSAAACTRHWSAFGAAVAPAQARFLAPSTSGRIAQGARTCCSLRAARRQRLCGGRP